MTGTPITMMPSFLPDEMLVSHFGRYAAIVGGEKLQFMKLHSPGESNDRYRVEYFERYLDQLIRAGHSLRSLFRRHAKGSNQELLNGIASGKRMRAALLQHQEVYKFCPVCAREDKDRYGEMYFRRSHQSDYVAACEKHHVYLCTSSVAGKHSRTTVVPFVDIDEIEVRKCEVSILIDVAVAIGTSYELEYDRAGVVHTFGAHLKKIIKSLVHDNLAANDNRRFLFDKRLRDQERPIRFRIGALSDGALGDLEGDLVASSEIACDSSITMDGLIFLATLLGQSRALIYSLANGTEAGKFKLLAASVLEAVEVNVDPLGVVTLTLPLNNDGEFSRALPYEKTDWSFLRQYSIGERSKRRNLLCIDAVDLRSKRLFSTIRL